MSEIIDTSIGDKFATAQKIISAIYPNLTTFYMMCNRRVNDDITFRLNTVDGISPTVEYGTDFLDHIDGNTLAVLLSIELFRLVLHHPTSRLMYPTDICYMASNVICTDDTTILKLPIEKEIRKKFITFEDVRTIEPTLDRKRDFYMERIFNVLLNNNMKNDAEGVGKNSSNGSDGDDALTRHFKPDNMKKLVEKWGENEIIDTKVRNKVLKEMETTTWSKFSGGISALIKKANELQYDPRAIFSKFARSVFSPVETLTRMKPPRRAGQNYIGIIAGKRHERKARVLLAFDASGSMSDDDLSKGLDFMSSCLKYADVYYCWWDCSCSEFVKTRGEKKECELSGRGGTNPQCVIEKLKESKLAFDGIVFFTDCYFEWPRPQCKQSICIVQTDKSGKPPEWVKWSFRLKDLAKYNLRKNR